MRSGSSGTPFCVRELVVYERLRDEHEDCQTNIETNTLQIGEHVHELHEHVREVCEHVREHADFVTQQFDILHVQRWSTFTEETRQEKEQEAIKRVMMELDKKNLKLNEEWKEKTGKEEDQAYSQGIDEDTNDSSSDSSDFDVKEDGLDEDEYVDDAGKSITADQVRETLAAVLKKHQEKLNQDLQDMAQKGSFEEEGVLLSEEEIVEENDGEESE